LAAVLQEANLTEARLPIWDRGQEAHIAVLLLGVILLNRPANLTSGHEPDPLVIEEDDVLGVEILHHVLDTPVRSYPGDVISFV
jgi:hypothetical protein